MAEERGGSDGMNREALIFFITETFFISGWCGAAVPTKARLRTMLDLGISNNVGLGFQDGFLFHSTYDYRRYTKE
jgi:hypothetical protein